LSFLRGAVLGFSGVTNRPHYQRPVDLPPASRSRAPWPISRRRPAPPSARALLIERMCRYRMPPHAALARQGQSFPIARI